MTGRPQATNVGIFGGTFDPPHAGHLIVAQDAALALGLDRILFVPAARPPHKLDLSVSDPKTRATMLELAIRGDDRFGIDTLELDRAGASYTVDTLRELAGHSPDVCWTLLIGADQYAEFGTWREPDEIRRLARLAVLMRHGGHGSEAGEPTAERSGSSRAGNHAVSGSADRVSARLALSPAVHELSGGDVAVDVTRIDISATIVRKRVAEGLPIRYLVPRAVEEFIFERKLYLGNGTPVTG